MMHMTKRKVMGLWGPPTTQPITMRHASSYVSFEGDSFETDGWHLGTIDDDFMSC
jgi:hypothetical protein